jgi:hypothetical protein
MRKSQSTSYLQGRRIRMTRLDACFRPVYGDDSVAVSKGFVSVSYTANTVESDEINQQNASGEVCLYEPSQPSLTGYGVEIVFCEVDPELFSLVTGQEVYLDGDGNPIGFSVGTDIDISESRFAFELWMGTKKTDTCANPNAQGKYGYLLLPALQGGIVTDFEVQNGAINFTITGAATRDGNQWGKGPFNVMLVGGNPAPLVTAISPQKHLLLINVEVAPPEPYVGTRPLMDPEATPITAIVAAEGASPMEAAFTFTGGSTDPVWTEFGDGTWDFVEPGSAGASHVYAANGTYTVRATSNGTWVQTTVTVPFP